MSLAVIGIVYNSQKSYEKIEDIVIAGAGSVESEYFGTRWGNGIGYIEFWLKGDLQVENE